MSRHARNQDANHVEVVARFRALGCTVLTIQSAQAGCPDVLVGRLGTDVQVEIKDGRKVPSARRRTPAQLAHATTWRGRPVELVECAEDVDAVVSRLVRASVVMRGDAEVDPSDWERP